MKSIALLPKNHICILLLQAITILHHIMRNGIATVPVDCIDIFFSLLIMKHKLAMSRLGLSSICICLCKFNTFGPFDIVSAQIKHHSALERIFWGSNIKLLQLPLPLKYSCNLHFCNMKGPHFAIVGEKASDVHAFLEPSLSGHHTHRRILEMMVSSNTPIIKSNDQITIDQHFFSLITLL